MIKNTRLFYTSSIYREIMAMNLLNILKYSNIKKKCKIKEKNLDFDMSDLDKEVSDFAWKIYDKNKTDFLKFKKFSYNLGFWGSRLYDTGGHTPCLVNLADSMYEGDKKNPVFLSKYDSTIKKAPLTIEKLNKCCEIFGVEYSGFNFKRELIEGYNKIIENCPKVFILYIAQQDIYSTALIYLLKKTTDIKFIFFDHASHYPNLAMTLADVIVEELETCKKTLIEKRHITNIPYRKCGLQSKKKEEVKYYSFEEKQSKRKELAIPKDALLTVSGGSSYKYFDGKNSPHYEMIKKLLESLPNLYHLAITNLTSEQKKIVNRIFEKSEAKNRLIFHSLTPEYDILFQMADLFIDSFPMSSAMTQIDLMAMKVPSVVKINSENPELTFHEYMPKNYPYMYEKVEDMEDGIVKLLLNEGLREEIKKYNYEFWLNNYEAMCVKNNYLKLINLLNPEIKLINFLDIPFETQLKTRDWRNSEDVKKWFKIPYIEENTHKNWLVSLKEDFAKNIAFIISCNEKYVGVTYFHSIDYKRKEAEWGIYIHDSSIRGFGIGKFVLKQCLEYLKNKGFQILYLSVLNSNKRAIALYKSFGFKFLYNEETNFEKYYKNL